jgi:hypothetical protein
MGNDYEKAIKSNIIIGWNGDWVWYDLIADSVGNLRDNWKFVVDDLFLLGDLRIRDDTV